MILLQKIFNKVKKHYMLCSISHTVTASMRPLITKFYQFKHSFMVDFLSKGCEVLHNWFLQCVLVHKSTETAGTGRKLTALDQDLPLPLSALLRHAEASLQQLIVLVSLV
jgi:hypothetical protein